MPGSKLKLSVILNVYNMAREAPRTLTTLSPSAQIELSAADYEVIIVDNGSSPPLSLPSALMEDGVFRLIRVDNASPSPAAAMNAAAREARGEAICIMIDGARMASPGLLRRGAQALQVHERAVAAALGWHLGEEVQFEAVKKGYNQKVEDALLETVPWREDGYRLFDISALAASSAGGYYNTIAESNALFMKKTLWDEINGFDERFDLPGGGLVNLDLYKRACEAPGVALIHLVGEGTFHQFHGGVAANSPKPRFDFHDQYAELHGNPFEKPTNEPILFGSASPSTIPVMKHSVDIILNKPDSPSQLEKQEKRDAPPLSSEERTALIVLGMHRSGTSATTRLLHAADAALSPDLFEAIHNNNPLGFYESRHAVHLNDDLLSELSSAWFDTAALPSDWLNRECTNKARTDVKELLNEHFASETLFAMKDPRFCRLLPIWRDALEEFAGNVVYVFVGRDPDEIAASLSRRNNLPESKTHWLTARHLLEAEQYSRGKHRIFTTFDEICADPKALIEKIVDLQPAAQRLLDTAQEQPEKIKAAIDPRQRNHQAHKSPPSKDASRGRMVVQALYDGMAKASKGQINEEQLQDLFDQTSNELKYADEAYEAAMTEFRWIADQRRSEIKALEEELAELRRRKLHQDRAAYKLQTSALTAAMRMPRKYIRRLLSIGNRIQMRSSNAQVD